MYEDVIRKGLILDLRTPAGHRIVVRRRGATAPGKFILRQRGSGWYIQYHFYVRGSRYPRKVHIGSLAGVR